MAVAQTSSILSADLDRRFGGLARLYGEAGAKKIRAAHVMVVGLGGVGSWAAEALARSGVARLTLIDLDHIAESNINRQVHALDTTLGQAKVEAMRERIAHINPDCDVRCVEEFVDVGNWPSIVGLAGRADDSVSIIDACDQVTAKTAMASWALRQNAKASGLTKINFLSVGAAGGKRRAHKVDVEDLALVTHDPLLAQLRYRLRKEQGAAHKGKIGITCVFSSEAVMKPASDGGQADHNLNCHGYGSVVTVTATFGLCAAGWLIGEIAT